MSRKSEAMVKVGRIIWSSPLEFIASRGGDAKVICEPNQSGQQGRGIGGGSIEGVVGEKIGGTAQSYNLRRRSRSAARGRC